MKRILLAAVLLWPLTALPAFAQLSNAVVVSACGTPPATYTAGTTRQLTQDTAGNACTDASATGTFTNPAAGTTGNAVPGSADYQGLNVGGNTRGQTGVNPSGVVYAGQVDLASVAGATVKTGNGTAAGSQRVSLASDSTGQVALAAGTAVVGQVQQAGNSFANITTATTTTPKSAAGVLHLITVNTLIASATVTVYDNTAASGTKIGTWTLPSTITSDQPFVIGPLDVTFATGLTIVTSGATDLTVSYR